VDDKAGSQYSAPALEKGLDILELLAATPGALSQNQIARRLGRSVGEIFRMLASLERRGYVSRRDTDGGYQLTLRLFELAHAHPPISRLLGEALEEMHALAEATGQSCHLAVYHGGRILIVAQAESPRLRSFAVKLGATFPLAQTASGRVLVAFQEPEERGRRLAAMLAEAAAAAAQDAEERLAHIRACGFEEAPSDVVQGITDLCFPILNHLGDGVAALTLPFVDMTDNPVDRATALERTAEAAERLSRRLGFNDVRPAAPARQVVHRS
jgi:DNA-binding IclR family transcriptional regulator